MPRIVSVRVDHLTLGSADCIARGTIVPAEFQEILGPPTIVTVLAFKNFIKFYVQRLPFEAVSQRLGVATVGKWEILVLMKLTWTPLFPIHTHGQEKEQAGLSSSPVKHNL